MIGVDLRALARADQARGLEAVDARHAHVEQDHREVVLEREAQRLLARLRHHQVLPERREQLLQREQALRLVVDEQDLRLLERLLFGGARLGLQLFDLGEVVHPTS